MDLSNFKPRPAVEKKVLAGRTVSLHPFDLEKHSKEIFEYFSLDPDGVNWKYLPYGPFDQFPDYYTFCEETYVSDDPVFFSVVPHHIKKAAGIMSLMRIDQKNGVVETGHLNFTPILQRTPAATESVYLLAKYIFEELGYRRFEWKCNDHNQASKNAAQRYGFTFEGVFRQHMVVKQQNRNTAWFSMLDHEWPEIKKSYENWLDPSNFDDDGVQKTKLNTNR